MFSAHAVRYFHRFGWPACLWVCLFACTSHLFLLLPNPSRMESRQKDNCYDKTQEMTNLTVFSQEPAFDSQVMFPETQIFTFPTSPSSQVPLLPPTHVSQEQRAQSQAQQSFRWNGRYLKKAAAANGNEKEEESDWQAHRRPHILSLAALNTLNPRIDVIFEIESISAPKKRIHQVRSVRLCD